MIVFLALTPTWAWAEPVLGGKVGLNLATWNRAASEPSPVERSYKYGVSGGGYLQIRYLDPLVPQIELLFTNRGTELTLNGINPSLRNLNYIDLLLLARIELPLKVATLYALAGPELNFLLTATATDASGFTVDQRDGYNSLDLGVLIGTGVAVGPFSWGTLTFEARYDRGFIDVFKAYEGVTLTNQTIAFLVGYEYRRDRDRDGIADGKDRCPRQAEDRDGFEDSDGCPDTGHDSAAVTRYP